MMPNKKTQSQKHKEKDPQLTLALGEEQALPGYSTEQVAGIVQISKRKLDHWTTKGLVRASVLEGKGSGSSRYYSYWDILEINLVKNLRDSGLSLEVIEGNFAYIRNQLNHSVYNATLVLSDGQPAVITSEQKILTLASQASKPGRGQGILNLNMFNLAQIKEEVDGNIKEQGVTPVN